MRKTARSKETTTPHGNEQALEIDSQHHDPFGTIPGIQAGSITTMTDPEPESMSNERPALEVRATTVKRGRGGGGTPGLWRRFRRIGGTLR